MSSSPPTNREHQILMLIHNHYIEHDEPPSNDWLAEELFQLDYPINVISKSLKKPSFSKERKGVYKNVLTILGRLEDKGYIERPDKRSRLTEAAFQYFESLNGSLEILPIKIKLAGRVRAGRKSDIDLEIDITDVTDSSITIPDANPSKKIYALEVEGNSMEHEHIFEGDYVIVEEFDSNEWPKNGEMIVTKYLELPEYLRNDPVIDVNDFELSGHTLKIYNEVQDKNSKYYRLSWRRDHVSNPHMIKAIRLEPVGRVIGVYRKTKR